MKTKAGQTTKQNKKTRRIEVEFLSFGPNDFFLKLLAGLRLPSPPSLSLSLPLWHSRSLALPPSHSFSPPPSQSVVLKQLVRSAVSGAL